MNDSRLLEVADRLYAEPLSGFTPARDAAARAASTGEDADKALATRIKSLRKPSVAAWAVNQVYWQQRDVYDRLMEAAGDLRAAHAAVLSGKRADVRESGKAHEEAIDAAQIAAATYRRHMRNPPTRSETDFSELTESELPGWLPR